MKPLTKSAIITIFGYIIATIAQFFIYPLFGLVVSIYSILTLGLIFTAVAFISNYTALKAIEYFEEWDSLIKSVKE